MPKKILAILATARTGGNTNALLEHCAKGAEEMGAQVEVLPIGTAKIAGCLGCDFCRNNHALCIQKDDIAVWFTIQTKPEIMRYIVEKGSVAIDGISLTVAKTRKDRFSVSTIPHTVRQTALQERKEGDFVNLETDIIGKYIEKLLSPFYQKQTNSSITKELLEKYGF